MPERSFVSRRSVLLGGAATVAAAGLATATAVPAAGAGRTRLQTNPFTLGVASGDPLADSVVLWTRLAVDPLADTGLGGMPSRDILVEWQLARDPQFTKEVRTGQATARAAAAHSVHLEPGGMRAGTEYYYRFRVDGHYSATGRTVTAPRRGTMPDLTMCFASCSHFGEGYFTAYRRLAEDNPHLILHLGDYQYEYPTKASDVRTVLGPETRTLANYRQRHGQYKTDPDLQLAHATAPWLVVWDDHETENNWAADVPETPDPNFLDRRAMAFQAYYENMPLRSTSRPHGSDMRLFRRFSWGDTATFHMLDTRQYRDDQACGDGVQVNCADRLDPARSITGEEQERWLLDGLNRSRARWDVLGQQVFFSQLDLKTGAELGYNMDAWDGYKADRDRIASALGSGRVRNGVVLTGDVHRHWAGDVKEDADRPDAKGVGVELVATSVTSSGDGDDDPNSGVLAENPNIKFYKNRRGYVRTTFTAREMRADFRVLPYVRTAGAPASTAAGFVVEDRVPNLNPG